jgi:polyvinyl alcohol dehydrogenase (cytochrome)
MRGIWVAAAAVAAASLSAPAGALADWPVYGHDLANSRNAGPAGPPRSEAGSLTRAWTFNSPTGDFTGTPVVAGGVLVAGNNGGWVYALDAVTGKVRWSRDLGSPINGSAAIDGNTAFVPVAKPGAPRLVALSLEDGSVRWSSILINQASASVYGSPTFWRGSVYIGTSGPNTDDTRARGSVVALDESSGAIRWQTFMVPPDRDGAAVWSTPAIDPATGRLYVGTGNNYHPPTTNMEDSIVALDAADGHVVGHYQATKDDSFAGGDNPAGGPDFDFGASPNLFTGAHGEQFVGEGQKSGTYWAVDRATMQPVWSANVGPGGPLGGILGSTAFDGERIYGGDTLDGQVFALGRDGSISWQSADPGGLHTGPATIAGGVLYNTDPSGVLDVRDPATGLILGKLPLGNPALGGVSAAGSAIYVAVGTGPLPQPAPQSDNPGSIVAWSEP